MTTKESIFLIVIVLLDFSSVCLSMVTSIPSSNIDALVDRSFHLLEKSNRSQVFIALAGGPGSGKSSLAQAVSSAINERQGAISVVVPMDGYHIPRAELERLGSLGIMIGDPSDTKGNSTMYEDLMRRRGAPWTFDPESLYRDLKDAKETGAGSFPIYSREIGDPVPDGVILSREHKIILCEGNYLLAFDDMAWKPLEAIWDDKWLIKVCEDVVIDRLVNRHLQRWNKEKRALWGEGRAGALAKVEASDLRNTRWIEATSGTHADLLIEN